MQILFTVPPSCLRDLLHRHALQACHNACELGNGTAAIPPLHHETLLKIVPLFAGRQSYRYRMLLRQITIRMDEATESPFRSVAAIRPTAIFQWRIQSCEQNDSGR